ncbi:hypothetical protein [Sphingomonas sp.]|uniref:hypothetical protein n=1 Tax=Sphingomonas sp. TaxID=28214 RepID=UPI0038AF4C68
MNSVTAWVAEAINSYRGDSLQCVLIGSDYWDDFLSEVGAPADADEVEFHNLVCRKSSTPDKINLVIGY